MGILSCVSNKSNIDSNKTNLDSFINIGDKEIIEDNLFDFYEVDINNKCLKIHILGSGDKMQNIIENIFKEDVNENLKDKFKVTKQLKTEQFHWIAHIYKSRLINEDLCKEIEKEIKEDRQNRENEKIILKNQVILCFGNENTELLSSYFKKFRKSNIIFITESECKISEKMDKRYGTNIIYKNLDNKEMSNENLNNKIISLLWELDCYFKENGNLKCRYCPGNIFNGLENDNTIFTLNILVTGLTRAGKSTFINLTARKLSALESDLAVSVTKKITDYYIFKNNKNENRAIKLIDIPGLVKNKTDKDYKDKENKIKQLIRNENKTFNKRIHFIFFILLKDSKLQINDSNNVKEIFQELNNTKVPVFFIINKVKTDSNFNQIISSIKESLNQNGFKNLSKDENFIPANFVKGDIGEIHGIDTIFSKILNHVNNKNYFDNELQLKMENLSKDFRATVESDISFLSLKKENDLKIRELKDNIKFNERMSKINDMIKDNSLFSNINIESLIEKGNTRAKQCLEVILSLSNLNNILPNISQNLPAISIYQAIMVKEIGEGFGFDIDILNPGTTKLLEFLGNYLHLIEKKQLNIDNDINKIDVEEFKNIIQQKAQDILQKSKNNRDTILSLADLLNRIMKVKGSDDKNYENQNFAFTLSIYKYCIYFFSKEIRESEGICFMTNYYNKLKSLMEEDINYYKEKKVWEKNEILIIK